MRCGGLVALRALWRNDCATGAVTEGLRRERCGGRVAPRALWRRGCAFALWRKGCASCAVEEWCAAADWLRRVCRGRRVAPRARWRGCKCWCCSGWLSRRGCLPVVGRCAGVGAAAVVGRSGADARVCAAAAAAELQVLQREAEPEGCLSIVGCCAGVGAVVVLERSGADAQDCAAAAAELQVLQWGG